MAIVSLANLTQTFEITSLSVSYTGGAFYGEEENYFAWVSAEGNETFFWGENFSYDINGVPTGGEVLGFSLDLDDNDLSNPEIDIDDLSFDLSVLAPLANGTLTTEQQNNLLWRTVLAGNDEIDLGSNATALGFRIYFAGDGRILETGQTVYAGNDTITGDAGIDPSAGSGTGEAFNQMQGDIEGDFETVAAGAFLYGGMTSLRSSAGRRKGTHTACRASWPAGTTTFPRSRRSAMRAISKRAAPCSVETTSLTSLS